MSDYETVMKLKAYADDQGVTLSELGRQGGLTRAARRRSAIPRFKRMASKYTIEQIQGMPWNK